MSDLKDTLFQQLDTEIGSFRFDERVADVFNDMISRSVPGYRQILSLLPTLTRIFAAPDHSYYDLGCSTGAGLAAMATGLGDQPANLIGIDNSAPMIKQARRSISALQAHDQLQIDLVSADITDIKFEPMCMCLLNFTLQFIPVDQRDRLLSNICHNLKEGGVLVLSEKLKSSRPEVDEWLVTLHHQFKADQGYSQLEISKKRDAIENVLIPETLETHLSRLRDAGFSTVFPWIRNLQFVSLLAIK